MAETIIQKTLSVIRDNITFTRGSTGNYTADIPNNCRILGSTNTNYLIVDGGKASGATEHYCRICYRNSSTGIYEEISDNSKTLECVYLR